MILNQEEYKSHKVWMLKKIMINKKNKVHKKRMFLKKKKKKNKKRKKNHMKMRMKTLQDHTQRHHLGGFRRIIPKLK